MTVTNARAALVGAVVPFLLLAPPAFAQGADGTITLSVADWLTPWEADRGGGWIVVPEGTTPTVKTEPHSDTSLAIAPGTYDVFWRQNASVDPVIIETGVAVEAGETVTVRVATGIQLELADWAPERVDRNGWFGAILPDAQTFDFVNALVVGDGLYLPPGDYSIFYQPDLRTDIPALWLGEVAVENAFGGVGLELSLDNGAVTVVRVLPSGPADMAGVRDGDVLLSVDGNSFEGLELAEAVALLRGAPASEAVLTVRRSKGEPIEIAITRSTVEPERIVRANSGISLAIDGANPLGPDGYWGVTYAGDDPDLGLINWSGSVDAALLVGPTYYDVYWSIDGETLELIAEDVAVNSELVAVAPAPGK